MITITIAEVAIKRGTSAKGDWVSTRVKDTEGNWYNSFNTQAPELKADMVITFEVIMKGENKNFDKWAVSDHSPVDTPALIEAAEKAGVEKVTGQATTSGKNRAFALSYSKDIDVALIMAGVYKQADDVTTIIRAKMFESYLDSGVVVTKK